MTRLGLRARFGGVSIMVTWLLLMPVLTSAAARAAFEASRQEARLHFHASPLAFTCTANDHWTHLVSTEGDAGLLQIPGQPLLPCREVWISIPQQAQVKAITVSGHWQQQPLALPVIPAGQPTLSRPQAPQADGSAYQNQAAYPQQDYDYAIRRMGSARVLIVRLYMLKYLGRTQSLLVSSGAEVAVVLTTTTWDPDNQPRNIVDRELQKKLWNSQEAFFGLPLEP